MIVIFDESSRFANRWCRASGEDYLDNIYAREFEECLSGSTFPSSEPEKSPPDHTIGGLLLLASAL
jgi:hypothetical protein